MPIPVVCPACATRLKAPDGMAGRKTKCPKCQTSITVGGEAAPLVKAAPEAKKEAAARPSKPMPAPAPKAPPKPPQPQAVTSKPAPPPPAVAKKPAPAPKVEEVEEVEEFDEVEPVEPVTSIAKKPKPAAKVEEVEEFDEVEPVEAVTSVAKKPKAGAKASAGDYDDLEIVKPGSRPEADQLAAHWETSELGQRHRFLVTTASAFSLKAMVYRDYDILDPVSKKRIGICSDAPGTIIQCLRVVGQLRKYLIANLEVRESEDGPLLFRIRRIPQLLRFYVVVDVYDGADRKIGYFQTKIFSFFGGFWIFDANDNKVGEFKFKLGLPPRFVFATTDNTILGDVMAENMRTELKAKKASFSVTIGRNLGADVEVHESVRDDPAVRMLLLAATIATQFAGIGGQIFNNSQK